jgi:hypothetical protein
MKHAAAALALAVLLSASSTWADGSVTVEVGKTKRVDVGLSQGLNCDDLSVADVSIRNRSAEQNELVIVGLKPGRTTCRAGTPMAGATAVVKIVVIPADD